MQRSHNRYNGPQKGLEVLSSVGIEGIRNVPDAFGMPVITITGLQTLTQIQQSVTVEQSAQLSDAVTWIRGRHTWKAGLDGRLQFPNVFSVPVSTYGNFSFTGAFSGNAYADFLLGLPQQSQRTFPSSPEYLRQWS